MIQPKENLNSYCTYHFLTSWFALKFLMMVIHNVLKITLSLFIKFTYVSCCVNLSLVNFGISFQNSCPKSLLYFVQADNDLFPSLQQPHRIFAFYRPLKFSINKNNAVCWKWPMNQGHAVRLSRNYLRFKMGVRLFFVDLRIHLTNKTKESFSYKKQKLGRMQPNLAFCFYWYVYPLYQNTIALF